MHEIMERFHEEAQAYYQQPEYQLKVERLERILEPVRGHRIGWDLEGVLINQSPFSISHYPMDSSWEALTWPSIGKRIHWRFCRPLAQEVLQILDRHNKQKLCTAAHRKFVDRVLKYEIIAFPSEMEFLTRDDETSRKDVKNPLCAGVDILIDDFECEDEERTLRCPSFGVQSCGQIAMRSDYNRRIREARKTNEFDHQTDFQRHYERREEIDADFEGVGISLEQFKRLYQDEGMLEIAQVMADFFEKQS